MKRLGMAILACLYISAANAAYVVMDDEPTAQSEPQQYTFPVPFLKHRSLLIKDAINAIQDAMPYLRNHSIKITAKSDATLYTGGKLASLVHNRAYRLRDYLLAQGIPASSITIELDNIPNPQQDGVHYPSYITILNAKPQIGYMPKQDFPQQGYNSNVTLLPEDMPAKELVAHFILSSAQNNLMAGASALRLLSLMDTGFSTTKQSSAPIAQNNYQNRNQPYPAPIRPPFQAQPDHAMQWMLSPDKSLEANLRAWAAISNFSLKWSASNPYQVKKFSIIPGNFLDAVDKVATAAGLSMSVSPNTSTIFINDKSE